MLISNHAWEYLYIQDSYQCSCNHLLHIHYYRCSYRLPLCSYKMHHRDKSLCCQDIHRHLEFEKIRDWSIFNNFNFSQKFLQITASKIKLHLVFSSNELIEYLCRLFHFQNIRCDKCNCKTQSCSGIQHRCDNQNLLSNIH